MSTGASKIFNIKKIIISYWGFLSRDIEWTTSIVCFLPSSHGKYASVSEEATEKF